MMQRELLLDRLFGAVEDIYLGKDGCACGCGGSYARVADGEAATVRRRLNRAVKLWSEVGPKHVFFWPDRDGAKLYVACRSALAERERIIAVYVRPEDLGLSLDAAAMMEALAGEWSGSVFDLFEAAANLTAEVAL